MNTKKEAENDSLQLAKTLWVEGDWDGLIKLAKEITDFSNQMELAIYLATAFLHQKDSAQVEYYWQLGQKNVGSKLDGQEILSLFLSGVHNTLARARTLNGDWEKAKQHWKESISIVVSEPQLYLFTKIRLDFQLEDIDIFPRWSSSGAVKKAGRKKNLFIDCGGYDGCSVIKFLLKKPNYDVITFEANPDLWKYYKKLPTKLIRKAVYNYNGLIEFTIDPIDADGSSLIKEKKVDYNQKIKNNECPKIDVECVDLSEFIKKMSLIYSNIELKLDVEGAEYAILKKMLADDSLKYISHLYAEFHWSKIQMDKESHDEIIEKVSSIVDIDDWDAQEFGVHKRDGSALKRRFIIENMI